MDLDFIRKVNGMVNKNCKEAHYDELTCGVNNVYENALTEFNILINSKKAIDIIVNDKVETKALMRYLNNKSSGDTGFYIEIKTHHKQLNIGDLVKFKNTELYGNQYYLVTSIPQAMKGYDLNYIHMCNQEYIVDEKTKLPCVVAGESYGVKIISNVDFINQVDTKVKVYLSNNESVREKVKMSQRFILEKTIYGVYKVGDYTVYKNGLVILTCQKDRYMENLDNFETGVAFQPLLKNNVKSDISGEFEIGYKKPYRFKYVASPNNDLVFTIQNNEIATLTQLSNNECEIVGNSPGEVIELKVISKGVVLAIKNIMITRW